MQLPIHLYRSVVDRLAAGNEVGIDFCVPVCKLNGILRAEPIGAPTLKAHPLPSNPVSDDVSLVRVQIVIEIIEINILPEPASIGRRICVDSLYTEIQLWQSRKPRHIDSGTYGESFPNVNGRLAVVYVGGIILGQQSVGIKLQPIAHVRERVGEIRANRPLSGIVIG
jgi:hypothetical protein